MLEIGMNRYSTTASIECWRIYNIGMYVLCTLCVFAQASDPIN